jgi:lipoprotein-anchoring transpeptidase ErfK/SrfK
VIQEPSPRLGRWPAALMAALVVGCAREPGPGRSDARSLEASGNEDNLDAAPEDAPDEVARALAERAEAVERARRAYDSGAWEGGDLYAAAMRTSVMSAPAWPEDPDAGDVTSAAARRGQAVEGRDGGVHRLGYIRHGSHVAFFPTPIPNDDCPNGWYELLEQGFICGKYASPDPRAPSVKFAANPPNLAEPTPYKYGYAVLDNTPVYRRVLSLHDRQKYEPELLPPPPPAPDAGAPADASAGGSPGEEVEPASDEPERDKRATKEPKDAGLVKLGDLRGRGVLVRRMMKGFYVALDRAFNAAHARWWRTSEGFAIPYERIALQSWTPDFHGSWVKPADAGSPTTSLPSPAPKGASSQGGSGAAAAEAGEAAQAAEAGDAVSPTEGNGTAALVNSGYAARFVQNDKGKMAFTTPLPKWTALELAGEPLTVDGVVFDRTTSGFWVRQMDLMVATPEPPADLAEAEKWIDVDLGRQLLVAFEGKHPVYATRVSSGRRYPWDPTHDHPTPTGTFRIYEKHVSTTMDGDVASDGPYSIEDVPWVMYFQGSYALHGAFWHNLFGSTRSHGCVNLSPRSTRGSSSSGSSRRCPRAGTGSSRRAARPGDAGRDSRAPRGSRQGISPPVGRSSGRCLLRCRRGRVAAPLGSRGHRCPRRGGGRRVRAPSSRAAGAAAVFPRRRVGLASVD